MATPLFSTPGALVEGEGCVLDSELVEQLSADVLGPLLEQLVTGLDPRLDSLGRRRSGRRPPYPLHLMCVRPGS